MNSEETSRVARGVTVASPRRSCGPPSAQTHAAKGYKCRHLLCNIEVHFSSSITPFCPEAHGVASLLLLFTYSF